MSSRRNTSLELSLSRTMASMAGSLATSALRSVMNLNVISLSVLRMEHFACNHALVCSLHFDCGYR